MAGPKFASYLGRQTLPIFFPTREPIMDLPTPEGRTGSASFCWICGRLIDLKTCKTDEYGNAVHESCCATRIRKMFVSKKKEKIRANDV